MVLQNTGRFKSSKDDNSEKNEASYSKDEGTDKRLEKIQERTRMDERYGFQRYKEAKPRTGWLINMKVTEVADETNKLFSAVDYYFIEDDGERFKATLPFKPYFFLSVRKGTHRSVSSYLMKKYQNKITSLEQVNKEDLDLHNHLIGIQHTFLKLSFATTDDLNKVKREITPAIKKNKEKSLSTVYEDMLDSEGIEGGSGGGGSGGRKMSDQLDNIVDIREHDVPFHVRVSIDLKIFIGHWYDVIGRGSAPPEVKHREDIVNRPEPVVMAYDIETTKLPLKFPDSTTDQIMMISYMINGQGYLICNREIISADVDDFEYTPKPEFEGPFVVFNEESEVALIRKFFDHILEVKPNIFVTYNGDFFDWPFVEARAGFYGINMENEIGFAKDSQGEYKSRPAVHMDAFRWVKRDSYLPVGSQNLKAVTKAKLRYDPVELDPEEMCRLASEEPEVLANYSVSDAVATYYLYMKYVHPFVFALCTIIPMDPDEVLRKGSGTLCEALLMVEAFVANIIYPNKQEQQFTKFTNDGHLLDSETYVGGHVEALECGVFRADIPCRFRMVPEAFQTLMDNARRTLTYAIEVEEKIPLDTVTNFEEVISDVESKLCTLRDCPNRLENPIIYHLDVAAMYPNIILTNRLQPPAIVEEHTCAACDFNKPDALCQRHLTWSWRGDYLPATRGEYHRIQQQLEMEKFPPQFPGGQHRAFHQLSKEEQASFEKKRLSDYCRKAYKKTKVTKVEERVATVCQRENSFYVDTVRAFRDRRYKFKGLVKTWKGKLGEAEKAKDAAGIKQANGMIVLYDSLQLAHKCILNSFYGYVMRKGARWYSMEMAGIVCYTGASIITQAREIVEQIGRPLELDTDGIWCILPATFPENYVIKTNNPKKPKVTISYPGAMLNVMVKDSFTNTQYHEFVDPETLKYEVRHENSIFFEVDGPYLSMILPASKEEGKKLKKRYAVFNFDGSLAELKGFEVKRRGELQLIKIFQSSVFNAFLKGNTLDEVYSEVAKVANYWLDILYSKGHNLPDYELFDLISENRSMSRKLEEYEGQKSTSIKTAQRLAEFLGDQMVQNAGLSCQFIIAKKPLNAPVTDRAIPLAIFQADDKTKRHYLKRWLKDPSMHDFDIREILDWQYYIERLGSTIQKIITIPAALQSVSNPVVRCEHPPWLQKKLAEKNDVFKQKKINSLFLPAPKPVQQESQLMVDRPVPADIEDLVSAPKQKTNVPVASKRKRTFSGSADNSELDRDWRDVLGPVPDRGHTKAQLQEWLKYQKRKWSLQLRQRAASTKRIRMDNAGNNHVGGGSSIRAPSKGLGGFLRQKARTMYNQTWQVVQIAKTRQPGVYKLWAVIGNDLHSVKLHVPRIFYVNHLKEKETESHNYKRVTRILPRNHPVFFLYEYSIPEHIYQQHSNEMNADLSSPDVEGVYELQVPLEFRALLRIGCVCKVSRDFVRAVGGKETDTFDLSNLDFQVLSQHSYLESGSLKTLYLYHHMTGTKQLFSLFNMAQKKCTIFVLDTVKTNQMPNMAALYNGEHNNRISSGTSEELLPEAGHTFDIKVENQISQVYKGLQKLLQIYQTERKGPTMIAVQTKIELDVLMSSVASLEDFPIVPIPNSDSEGLYGVLDWQRVGARRMVQHYLSVNINLQAMLEQCRYLHVPLGNLPPDPTLFGCDLFYARHLIKHNHILWCSKSDRPDLGGKEADDHRFMGEQLVEGTEINSVGCYNSICVELDVASMPVNTLLHSSQVNDAEGSTSTTSFDMIQQPSLSDMIQGQGVATMMCSYDETALCSVAFRIMKIMVTSWFKDVTNYQNVYADNQLVNFYRWLRDSSTLLYDSALRRTLHQLLKKVFMQLMCEMKHLGVTLVYANFNRLVICTKKHNVADALLYVEYITNKIRAKPLFQFMEINYQDCWRFMLWMNPSNFGGVKGKLPDAENNNEEALDSEQDSDDSDSPDLVMNWNIMHYLPETASCQVNFGVIIAGYILSVYKNTLEELGDRVTGSTPVRRKAVTSQNAPVIKGTGSADSVLFRQTIVTQDMCHQMFRLTQQIQKKLSRTHQNKTSFPEEFPDLPGSHLAFSNPPLEFVKTICQVMLLDANIMSEVTKMKRDLLKLISVREFSEEAQFVDPCLSYILPEVICKSCNYVRDLDLCRDTHRTGQHTSAIWFCPVCKDEYDTEEIEYSLLDAVNRQSMSYVLQDVKCLKCKGVKQTNLSQYCECAGDYENTTHYKAYGTNLLTFRTIARHFGMELLMETVQWMISMNPAVTTQPS